jgi:acyl carrier protein
MNRDNITRKVRKIISEILDVDARMIRGDSLLVDDLACDSINAVEIVYALQDAFGIQIPRAAAVKINTVDDIIDYVAKKAKRK